MATSQNGHTPPQSRRAGEQLALVTRDVVFRCPVCGQVLLRTDNEQFEGGDKRCPRTSCSTELRLSPRAVGKPPDAREWRRYTCNARRLVVVMPGQAPQAVGPPCGRKLFDSPTRIGRVWAYCSDPGCRHGWKGASQPVYLDGGEEPARRITGRAEVVIGPPRLTRN